MAYPCGTGSLEGRPNRSKYLNQDKQHVMCCGRQDREGVGSQAGEVEQLQSQAEPLGKEHRNPNPPLSEDLGGGDGVSPGLL